MIKDRAPSASRHSSVAMAAGVALAALATVKVVYILAAEQFDIARAPVAFLLPILLLVIAVVLISRGRRAGLWMVLVVSAVLFVVLVSAVVRLGTAQQNWADALLVFAGVPIAAAGVASAASALRGR